VAAIVEAMVIRQTVLLTVWLMDGPRPCCMWTRRIRTSMKPVGGVARTCNATSSCSSMPSSRCVPHPTPHAIHPNPDPNPQHINTLTPHYPPRHTPPPDTYCAIQKRRWCRRHCTATTPTVSSASLAQPRCIHVHTYTPTHIHTYTHTHVLSQRPPILPPIGPVLTPIRHRLPPAGPHRGVPRRATTHRPAKLSPQLGQGNPGTRSERDHCALPTDGLGS